MSTPYIGFGNDTLDKLPAASEGQKIKCEKCEGYHTLEAGTDGKTGEKTDVMFYTCGNNTYLAAVHGRLIIGTKMKRDESETTSIRTGADVIWN